MYYLAGLPLQCGDDVYLKSDSKVSPSACDAHPGLTSCLATRCRLWRASIPCGRTNKAAPTSEVHQSNLHACVPCSVLVSVGRWLLFPQETHHTLSRMFYPNELIRSGQLDTNPVRSIIAKCQVAFVTVSSTGAVSVPA